MPPARIFAFVDDLFFLAKIQETARKMNVKVEFVKTEKDLTERMGENGDDKPSLIIFDLNNVSAKPLSIIPKAEDEAEEGDQYHRLCLARPGRAEDEGAGSRMRHGGAALGVFAEPGADPASPRRSRRIARARTVATVPGFVWVSGMKRTSGCLWGRKWLAARKLGRVGNLNLRDGTVHKHSLQA